MISKSDHFEVLSLLQADSLSRSASGQSAASVISGVKKFTTTIEDGFSSYPANARSAITEEEASEIYDWVFSYCVQFLECADRSETLWIYIEYDPTWHYPVSVGTDVSPVNVEDDNDYIGSGIGFELSDFTPLEAEDD